MGQIELIVDSRDSIKVKTTENGKSKVQELKGIYKFNLVKDRLLGEYFDGTQESVSRLLHIQSYLGNYTDFRVYEYIRLSGGIDRLIDSQWQDCNGALIKATYLGDVLIILILKDGIISSAITILPETDTLYRYIANKIAQESSLVGEIPIEELELLSEESNVAMGSTDNVAIPQEIKLGGGCRDVQVKSKKVYGISIADSYKEAVLYEGYKWTPTKKIKGKEQSPVESAIRHLIIIK